MTQPDIFDEDAPWAEWLPELRHLLEAYASVPRSERFTDTDETPSKAMRGYLRMATYYPGRAFRATHEILDVLKYGLDEADVASNLASMPPIIPPPGRTREDCLIAMLPHLAAFTENGETVEPSRPETRWEWRERLPNLANLFASYFHQDADQSLDDLLDHYLATSQGWEAAAAVREIGELRALSPGDDDLADAVVELGSARRPPAGQPPGAWLDHIADRLSAGLDAAGYSPPEGRDPAYPAHDIRSVVAS